MKGACIFLWQCACMYVNIPLCRHMLTTWVSSCLWTKWWRGRSSHWSTKCQRYLTILYYQLILNIQSKFSLLKISRSNWAQSSLKYVCLMPPRPQFWMWLFDLLQTVQKLLQLLGTLEQWINETPPVDQPSRFGNKAYRTWFSKLDRVRSHTQAQNGWFLCHKFKYT